MRFYIRLKSFCNQITQVVIHVQFHPIVSSVDCIIVTVVPVGVVEADGVDVISAGADDGIVDILVDEASVVFVVALVV